MNQVIASLKCLYESSIPAEERRKHDKLLEKWQYSLEAWDGSLEILQDSTVPNEYRLFAAQTLRKKISLDIQQVEPQVYLAFRDTLLRVLTEGQVTHVIAIQLCLCLVHLAIYLDESIWPQPIEDLCNYLQRTTQRSPATRNILVEFLTLFPEEADAASSTFINGHSAGKRAAKLMQQNCEKVLQLVNHMIIIESSSASLTSTATHLQPNEICEFYFKWIRFNEDFQQDFILQYKIIEFAFQALRDDFAYDVASELLTEIIFQGSKRNWHGLFSRMGQGLVQTRDLLQHAMQEENEELLESIAYILADYAYYYLGELVTDEAIGKVVFALILDAADHSGDYKIIEMTFRIWENLTDFLKQQQSATTGYMQEILASLVRILLKKLQYPSEGSSSLSSWTSQKRDDFRAFRHCIGDSLKDCCDLLSIDLVLSILVPSLGATSDISLHVELESKLTALRLVSSCIQDAVAYSSLSRLFVELPHLWSMTKHPNVGKDPEITSLLQYAIILIISSYSPWIDLHVRNPTELLQLFTLLKEALESSVDSSSVNDSRQLQSVFGASCLALRHFCQCCSPRLLSIYPESGQIVHHFYTIHETTLTIDTDCLFKSLVFLILAANGSSSDEMVLKLATDLVQHKIAPLLKVTHAGNASTSALTIAYLERYKILIEESKVQGKFNGNYSDEAVASSNHPLLDNFRIFLQVLLFDYHHTMQSSLDGPLEESICKVIRVALHSISSESFLLKRSNEETLFSTLIDFMQIAFNKSTNPTAILYLTQTLIRQFSHLNPPYTTTILAFVTQIHGDLLTMTPGRVTWTVQLLEDYFHLIAVMMEYLPEAVLCQQSYNSSSSTTASTSILIYPPQSILQLVMSFLDTLQDCEFDPAQLHIMFTVTLDLLHVLFEETSYPINPSHLNPSLMPVMMKSLWRLAIQVFPAASPLIKDVSSIISLIIRVDTALSLHILKMECVQLLPDHLFSPYEKNRLQNEIEVLLLLGGQPGDENSNRKNLILFLRQVARTFQRRII